MIWGVHVMKKQPQKSYLFAAIVGWPVQLGASSWPLPLLACKLIAVF